MSPFRKIALSAAAAMLLLVPAGAAFAEGSTPGSDDKTEAMEINQAKVSMSEAIAAAENAVGGKGADARLEGKDADRAWQIEIATADGGMKTVEVDPVTGAVNQNPKLDRVHDDGEGDGDGESQSE